LQSRKDFEELCDSSWSDLATRRSLSRYATVEQPGPEDVFSPQSLSTSEEYEAPWALIQVRSDSKGDHTLQVVGIFLIQKISFSNMESG
jgi:hypothetical protein